MLGLIVIGLACGLAGAGVVASDVGTDANSAPVSFARSKTLRRPGKLPLRFEVNAGQVESDARFVAGSRGMSLFLADQGATLALQRSGSSAPTSLKLAVRGRAPVKPRGEALLETKSHYYVGNDRSRWRSNISSYARVVYPNVRDGVDLVFHGEEGQLGIRLRRRTWGGSG